MQEGKPLSWLDEVKRDAEFNYKKRLRDEAERKAYEASKHQQAAPPAPKPVEK